jgi:hypothetical protein
LMSVDSGTRATSALSSPPSKPMSCTLSVLDFFFRKIAVKGTVSRDGFGFW